jgi:hypothetical protein
VDTAIKLTLIRAAALIIVVGMVVAFLWVALIPDRNDSATGGGKDDPKLQKACAEMRTKALTDTKMSQTEKNDLSAQISRHC